MERLWRAVGRQTRWAARAASPRAPSPHLVLAFGALVSVLVWPGTRLGFPLTAASLLVQASAAAASLAYAWHARDRLRLAPLLAVTLLFQVSWVLTHVKLGVLPGPIDVGIYREQGETLLEGDYPRSEYPTGAVLLFAFEVWLGGGENRITHPLTMVPFQLATVAAVWLVRSPTSRWLAAVVAVWPLNAFHWESRFDLAPTALLVVGVVLGHRGQWRASGIALGAGTAVKWTPALASLVFFVWLVARGRGRMAGVHVGGFLAAWALMTIPFLLWRSSEVMAAYTAQSGRGITSESIWYLPLRAVGATDVHGIPPADALAPPWANIAAVVIQAMLLVALLALAARVRSEAVAAAIAALAPVLFLVTNRIFSPQFLVTMFAAWLLACALLPMATRATLIAAVTSAAATLANAFVFPYTIPYDELWQLASGVLFVLAVAVTAGLVRSARHAPAAVGRGDSGRSIRRACG